MTTYVLSVLQEEQEKDPVYRIVGIFDDYDKAVESAEILYESKDQKIYYFIEEYDMNRVYEFDSDDDDFEQKYSEAIEDLVKEGILDYVVGEDGKFYFSLTEKGKEELD